MDEVKTLALDKMHQLAGNHNTRHCAFCLIVCAPPTLRCGGCKRRTYCSKDCQQKDWSTTGNGQCHRNWCGRYDYGEEDIDWEVVPVPNKGLGIVAKKLIPSGYRIIVEPAYINPHAHPGIKDLDPKEASLEAKFKWNHLILEPKGPVLESKLQYHQLVCSCASCRPTGKLPYKDNGETFVALRTSRLNHVCLPNAGYSYDETARVVVIFAQRAIQPGEEITINYSPFTKLSQRNVSRLSALFKPSIPTSKSEISCPRDCLCTASFAAIEGEKLFVEMITSIDMYRSEEALEAGEELLAMDARLDHSWFAKAMIEQDLFEIGIITSKTLNRAKKHLERCLEFRRIMTPFSVQKTLKWEELLKNPEGHPNYMKIDKTFDDILKKTGVDYRLPSSLGHSPLLEKNNSGLKPKGMRHCAFCLKELLASLVKKCSGCKKRAYCSKECQSADWSIKGKGQGHKIWCGQITYGEEDVDWEVVPVPNKGLGVRTKRLIPAGFRIIVEPVFTDPKDHPGILDLEPKNGTPAEKMLLNAMDRDSSRDGQKPFLGLRASRINHACRPNASICYDSKTRVQIVYALQDIQQGEEVFITYSKFGNLERKEFGLNDLAKYGIICPQNCFCKDPDVMKLVLDGRKLDDQMLNLGKNGQMEECLKAGEKLLEIHRQLNWSWREKAAVHHYLYEVAVTSSKTASKVVHHLEESLKIRRILTPYSDVTTSHELILSQLLKHPNMFKTLPEEMRKSLVQNDFSYLINGKSQT